MRALGRSWRWVAVLALAGLVGCASMAPPRPGQPQPRAPDMSGRRVMVLPAQGSEVSRPPAHMDAELRFWLGDHAPGVNWLFPAKLQRVLSNSPALDNIHLYHLDVTAFRVGRVRRIGDPLFGDLRRLGAVVNARYALVPVAAAYVPNDSLPGRVEVAGALIDTMGGDVLWYGIAAGVRGASNDPRVVASAARAFARLVAR